MRNHSARAPRDMQDLDYHITCAETETAAAAAPDLRSRRTMTMTTTTTKELICRSDAV